MIYVYAKYQKPTLYIKNLNYVINEMETRGILLELDHVIDGLL